MFARRNRPMPPRDELQAMFPAGSRVVHNPHGTAPGIDLEVPRDGRSPCRVICLPGVPAEMVDMWHGSVAAAITGFFGQQGRRVICRRRIYCFGAGESQIESMLPDLIRRGRQPTVGITASKTTITLRVVAEGATEEECCAAMEPTVATIRECLGTLVFGEEDDELQHAVLRLLRDRKKTLATAECGTAGLLAEWLAGVEGSANANRGGLVLVEAAESVEAMAAGCRERFGADYGLAVLLPSPYWRAAASEGFPSPYGRGAGDEGGGPGVALIALASSEEVRQKAVPCGIHPAMLRVYIAKQALNFARLALLT